MKSLDLGFGGPSVTWFTFPKTRPLALQNSLGDYQGPSTGVPLGPRAAQVPNYSAPFAPVNSLPVTVIYSGDKRQV